MTLVEFLANLPKNWTTSIECVAIVTGNDPATCLTTGAHERYHYVIIEDENGCEVGCQKMADLDRGPYFDNGWAGWLDRLPVPVS